MDIGLIALLSLVAGGVGTLTGFGSSTIMVPVLLFSYTLPETLLIAGVVHWFGNIWKISLFRAGLDVKLILLFGLPGLVLTWVGASLVFAVSEEILAPILGTFLILYTLYIFFNHTFTLPKTGAFAVLGGAFSGFMCGIFGVGGAIRSAFLSAFNLPKGVYIATLGYIGLFIDSGRIIRYLLEGTTITSVPLWALPIFIGASLVGALIAKRVVDAISQQRFRLVIMSFLSVVAVHYIFWW